MRGWCLVGLVVLTVAGCNTTNTGNPAEMKMTAGEGAPTSHGGLGSGFGACDSTASQLTSLETTTELGLSANDVLAFAAGEHQTAIRWQTGGIATYAPESGEHALTIQIEPTGKKPRFVRYQMAKSTQAGGGTLDIGMLQDCSALDAIEIEVSIGIKSDGGALDEHLNATLSATNAILAKTQVSLDAAKLGGAFRLVSTSPAGFTLQQLALELALSPLGVSGSLSGILEMRSSSGDASGAATATGAGSGGAIANIGDDASCDANAGLPIAADRKLLGSSADDAIAALAPLGAIAGTWGDGQSSQFALSFERDGGPICALLEAGYLPEPLLPGSMQLTGKLHVKSADGRIDARWPVTMLGSADTEGDLQTIVVELPGQTLSADGSMLASTYGVSGIDASAYDSLLVSFRLTLGQDAVAMPPSGMFSVRGGKAAPCVSEPPPDPNAKPSPMGTSSSPGCRGMDFVELAAITW